MNPTIYSQLDSRWSSKPYPIKSSSFGGNGCGCCACTHVAMEQTSKANWTPENLRKWMIEQGYAYAGQGTSWEGITGTLKHIGHKNVVRIYNDPMAEAWKELNKGNRIGIILFSAGWGGKTKGKKVYWTSGGHYIAFNNYCVKNGKHYFNMKDSGGRGNSGVFCYEDSMYGVVSKLWIVEKISEEKKAYDGEYPTIPTTTKTANSQAVSGAVAWAKKIANDDSYGYKRWTSDVKTHQCPICKKLTGKYKGWNCIGYVSAAMYHGAGAKVKCSCSGLGTNASLTKVTEASWKERNGNDWKMISNGGKKGGSAISTSKLKAGDVLIQYNTDGTSQHMCMYAGNGYVYESATDGVAKAKQIRLAKYSGRRVNRAFRYTGKGKFTDKVVSGCLKSGDEGAEVKKLQKYLLWCGYGLGSYGADGDFGTKTETAVKNFQKAVGLTQDGKWTTECNAKAKEIKK